MNTGTSIRTAALEVCLAEDPRVCSSKAVVKVGPPLRRDDEAGEAVLWMWFPSGWPYPACCPLDLVLFAPVLILARAAFICASSGRVWIPAGQDKQPRPSRMRTH